MAFDPDAFLADEPQQSTEAFDPDAFLAEPAGTADQQPSAMPQDGSGSIVPGYYEDVPQLGYPQPQRVQAPQEGRSLLDMATGAGETALTTATGATTGAAGMIFGTLKGLAEEIRSGQFGTAEAADRIEQMAMQGAESLTYAPRTQAGQEYSRALGEATAPLAALTPASAEISGALTAASRRPGVSRRFEPEIDQTLGQDITPKIEAAKVVPGAKSIDDVEFAIEMGGRAREFAMNPKSPDFAEFVLKGGELTTDPIARQAVKQGLDRGLVSMVKTTTPETKNKMAAMLNVVKRGKQDLRYQNKNRPVDILGRSVEDRIKYISKVNSQAGKELSKAVQELPGRSINYSSAADSFIDGLGDFGVVFDRSDATGKLIPNFDNSVFAASAKPKRMIREILNRVDRDGPIDARQAHIDKKFIDELVNWGKNETGSAGQVEGLAKNLRGNVNQLIGDVSPEYRAANQKYSETVDLLDRFVKSSGAKLQPGEEGYNRAAGVGMRRTLSNAPSGAALRQTVDEIESVAKKYGADFKDSLDDQVSFANELDALFGPSAKTSLAGQTAQVIDRGAEVALGQKTLTGLAAETGMEALKRIRGVNEENALKALDSLVRTNYVMQ